MKRTPERGGYANGFKPKLLDTAAWMLTLQVPKSRGGETPFYPAISGTGPTVHPAGLLTGQDGAGAEADPARAASRAILDHVTLAPARQHPQAEAGDLAVPDEEFGGAGL